MGSEQSRNKTKNQEIIKYDQKFYICLNQTDGSSIKKETKKNCYQTGKDNICNQNEKDKNCNQSKDQICNQKTEDLLCNQNSEDVLCNGKTEDLLCYETTENQICNDKTEDKLCYEKTEDKICNRNTEETCMSEEDVLSHCCVLLEVGTDVVKRVDDEGEIDVTDDASCNCHLYSYSRRFYPYILFYCSISKYA